MVEVQEGAQPGAANDRASCSVVVRGAGPALHELSADALVKSFGRIVLGEFVDHVADMTFPEDDAGGVKLIQFGGVKLIHPFVQ
jgi:hypothetical protein